MSAFWTEQKFRVGDRVWRPLDMYSNPGGNQKHRMTGTVVSVQRDEYNRCVYAVLWDHLSEFSRGYFNHGLTKEDSTSKNSRVKSPS